MTLEQIKQDWTVDEPKYKELASYMEEELRNELENDGIFARVYSRVKTQESIVKKLYRDGGLNIDKYRDMNDKAGVRIICRFKDDKKRIAECVRRRFDVIQEEDKNSILEVNQLGYKSHHFDVTLRNSEDTCSSLIKDLICEIQVRTLCEDTWAEINHNLGYKGYINPPYEVMRQLFCLGGLLEVADDCFTSIKHEITDSAKIDEHSAINVLEPYAIKFFKQEFDRKLAIITLKKLLPLFDEEISKFEFEIDNFIKTNSEKITFILKERKEESNFLPFLSQPELFVIFLLIDTDPFRLKEIWEQTFPMGDLEKLSTWWGKPIHDIEIE